MSEPVIIGNATLYCGDCLEVLPSLELVDSVITDPPYDNRTAENFTGNRSTQKAFKVEKAGIPFGGLDSLEWILLAIPLSRRWTISWCAMEQVGGYRDMAPDRYVRAGFWDRRNSAPQFSGDRPATAGEACVIFHAPGKKKWSGGGTRAFWSGSRSMEGGNAGIGHPTPKPLWLMEEQVDKFTDRGEVVLDPFMGSGTTGIACMNLGRGFVGIELNHEYFDIACERIDQAQRQQRLFA